MSLCFSFLRPSFFRPIFFLLALLGMSLQQSEAFAQSQSLASLLSKLGKVEQSLGVSLTDLAMSLSERYSGRQNLIVFSENHIVIRDTVELTAFVSEISAELGVNLPSSAYAEIVETTMSVISRETSDSFLQTFQDVFETQIGQTNGEVGPFDWVFLVLIVIIIILIERDLGERSEKKLEDSRRHMTPPTTTQPAME